MRLLCSRTNEKRSCPGNERMNNMPAGESEQERPDNRLNQRIARFALLAADFSCRVGRAAARAGQCRGVDRVAAGTAGNKRHGVILEAAMRRLYVARIRLEREPPGRIVRRGVEQTWTND